MKLSALILFFCLVCFSCTENRTQEKDTSDGEMTKNRASKILKPFKKKAQVFNLSEESTIVGQEGTTLKIHREDLEFEDGTALKATDEVSILLKEFYKVSEMLQAGLSTMSDKGLLESGGMVHVSASSAGRTLKLKVGRSFEISFAPGKHEGMSLYYGEEQHRGLLWKKAEKRLTYLKAGFPFPQVGIIQSEEEYYQSLNETEKKLYNETKKLHKKFDANKFGWLNIDKLIALGGNRSLHFDNDSLATYRIFAVFKEVNAITQARSRVRRINDTTYQHVGMPLFEMLPADEPLYITAFRMGEQGDLEFAKTEIVLSRDSTIHLNFEAKTPEEIKASLAFLD